MSTSTNLGTETRSQILPTQAPEDTGFILPPYDFSAQIPPPNQIGVRRGDGLGDVVDAAKGVAYYADVIGFGESSTPLTRGMKFQRYGTNFFVKTGMKCSNGADMWQYMEGIPTGNALGSRLTKVIDDMYGVKLRGLAPGMVEDAKDALNAKPLLQAAFGNVYPVCKKVTRPVGDELGQIGNLDTGELWVFGPVQYRGSTPVQTHWVQDTNKDGSPKFVSKEIYDKTPKTEKFEDMAKASLVVAIALGCLAVAFTYGRK
jgi:hypothetical protein